MEHKNAIEFRNVSKRFGEVVANDHINLTLRQGEILSILGENGSGKTTLMNMLSGIYFPDEGHILVNGKEVTIRSPKDAFALKIGMIHQHFKLIPVLTAAESSPLKVETAPKLVATGSGIQLLTAADWAEEYPAIYESYMKNSENTEVQDYVADYPMISTLFEGYGFAKYYGSARGHAYVIEDVTSTGRPHALANCFTCKTPVMTAKAIEMGDAAYSLQFEDVLQEVNEPLSCFNCHANAGSDLVVTHTYLTKALGDEINMVDAATLSCGQCHVDYYFAPETKATTLPYTSLESMHPDAILDYYNNLMVDGEVFADYVNPSNGIRQLMVNHPELETFTAEGSVHRNQFTCADCHMGTATAADGTTYKSHYLTSPLENQELLDSTCAACHGTGLADKVHAIQAAAEERTYDIGYQLEDLIKAITEAVESGKYSEEDLNAIRMSYRNAQFYWNFVFVENSEGAHNSKLTNECLDKSEALIAETWALIGA